MRNIRPTFSACILAKLYRLSRACMSRAIRKTASGIGAGFQARAECLRWASARNPLNESIMRDGVLAFRNVDLRAG